MQKYVFLALITVCVGAAWAMPVANGGFERHDTSGAPADWTYTCANGCEGGMALDKSIKHEGSRSARLWSTSPQSPNVYCSLSQFIHGALPGITYHISLWAKGDGVGTAWFGGGPGWRLRQAFPRGTFNWRRFETSWTCPDGVDTFELRINVDSATKALWVDDVQISCHVDPTPRISHVDAANSQVVPIFPENGIKIDGDLSDWKGKAMELKGAGGRIDARFRLGWTSQALLVAVATKDASLVHSGSLSEMYHADSIQLAIDPFNEKSKDGYGKHDFEIGVGIVNGKAGLYAWHTPIPLESLDKAVERSVVEKDGVTTYEVAVPWKTLGRDHVGSGTPVGFDLVINDCDKNAGRVAAQWTPGVAKRKQPSQFKTLMLTDGPWAYLQASPKVVSPGGFVRMIGMIYLPASEEGILSAGAIAGKKMPLKAGLTKVDWYVSADGLQPGKTGFDFTWKDVKQTLEAKATVTLSLAGQEALKLIGKQEKRLPGIEESLRTIAKAGTPIFYPRADFIIARMFCRYCRDDVAHGRSQRALEVANEVKGLLDRVEKEKNDGVDVPVAEMGAVGIHDGAFRARCLEDGHESLRPVFLTGYGHFQAAIDALPIFGKIGINVIQCEIGPNSVVFKDGVHLDHIKDWLIPALNTARDNGVFVTLLISPHYFPEWAFKKWPEIKVENGFLKQSVYAPQVRAIYKKFLRALIPMIKDQPALQSICLSNEPVYRNAARDPFLLPLWHKYLKKKYGNIGALNAACGVSYTSFGDVPQIPFDYNENPGLLYDEVRFNQQEFAAWHAWMAKIIHEMAPNLPCHAKVMAMPNSRGSVFWGTDPWEFARLSQINGNDCSFMTDRSQGSPWASDWITQNMYYDLERSMKHVPVFNTENHIIRDREQGYVSPHHIYTAIWQGAVHGQGGSTTWTWERTYDRKSDFEGLILHRAACTAAMSRVALDLMRLAPQMVAIQNQPARVAILYSHAATLQNPDYVGARRRAYEALNFCGIPIGFITDAQVAAGLLKQYDCLILPDATAASSAAIDGIRQYLSGGGAVIGYGRDNLTRNEDARPVAPVKLSAVIDDTVQGEALRDEFLPLLAKAGVKPAVTIHTPTGTLPYGVEWRSAVANGRQLINLVDFTRKPVTVQLPAGKWTNLITRQRLPKKINLETDVPVLAAHD